MESTVLPVPSVTEDLTSSLSPNGIQIQDLSTIVIETLTSATFFYILFRTVAGHTTSTSFRNLWDISQPVGLDVANKLISAFFASLSSLTGLYVLSTYGGDFYKPGFMTYFLPCAMGYFFYDIGAMCEVYFARLRAEYDSSKRPKVSTRSE